MPAIGTSPVIPFVDHLSGGGPPPSSLLTGLAEWWPLNEEGGDRIGSFAATAMAQITAPGGQEIGAADGVGATRAVDFDSVSGNTKYSLSAANEAKFTGGNQDMAWAGWAYPVGAGNFISLFNKWGRTSPVEYLIYRETGSDKWAFLANSVTDGVVIQHSGDVIVTGQWYFIYCQYDAAAGKIGISIDNAAMDEHAAGGGLVPGTNPLETGVVDGSNIPFGRVQRTGVWNRLLTPAEVTYLYNSGNGRDYPFPP